MARTTGSSGRVAVCLLTAFDCLSEHGVDGFALDREIATMVNDAGMVPVLKAAYNPIAAVGLTAELVPGGPSELHYTELLGDDRLGFSEMSGSDAEERVHFSNYGPSCGLPARVLRLRRSGAWELWACSGEWQSPFEWSTAGVLVSTWPDWPGVPSALAADLTLLAGDGPRTYKAALDHLKKLIADGKTENHFHACIEQFPKLLAPGVLESYSKPRLSYPDGETSPNGKSYVEPDFIFRVGRDMYEVVEIERSSKRTQRSSGQNRAEVTQANFQLSEFEHFISSFPAELVDRFPGIQHPVNRKKVMVVGEEESSNPEVLRDQLPVDRVESWSEVVLRAEVQVHNIRDDPWSSAGA